MSEIEHFGERQFLSRDERDNVVLISEELILLHQNYSRDGVVELTISHLEKSGRVEIVVEAASCIGSPLDLATDDPGLGVAIVRGLSESVVHRIEDGRSRLEIVVKPERTK
jgi:hypothetical protein